MYTQAHLLPKPPICSKSDVGDKANPTVGPLQSSSAKKPLARDKSAIFPEMSPVSSPGALVVETTNSPQAILAIIGPIVAQELCDSVTMMPTLLESINVSVGNGHEAMVEESPVTCANSESNAEQSFPTCGTSESFVVVGGGSVEFSTVAAGIPNEVPLKEWNADLVCLPLSNESFAEDSKPVEVLQTVSGKSTTAVMGLSDEVPLKEWNADIVCCSSWDEPFTEGSKPAEEVSRIVSYDCQSLSDESNDTVDYNIPSFGDVGGDVGGAAVQMDGTDVKWLEVDAMDIDEKSTENKPVENTVEETIKIREKEPTEGVNIEHLRRTGKEPIERVAAASALSTEESPEGGEFHRGGEGAENDAGGVVCADRDLKVVEACNEVISGTDRELINVGVGELTEGSEVQNYAVQQLEKDVVDQAVAINRNKELIKDNKELTVIELFDDADKELYERRKKELGKRTDEYRNETLLENADELLATKPGKDLGVREAQSVMKGPDECLSGCVGNKPAQDTDSILGGNTEETKKLRDIEQIHTDEEGVSNVREIPANIIEKECTKDEEIPESHAVVIKGLEIDKEDEGESTIIEQGESLTEDVESNSTEELLGYEYNQQFNDTQMEHTEEVQRGIESLEDRPFGVERGKMPSKIEYINLDDIADVEETKQFALETDVMVDVDRPECQRFEQHDIIILESDASLTEDVDPVVVRLPSDISQNIALVNDMENNNRRETATSVVEIMDENELLFELIDVDQGDEEMEDIPADKL